jgi:hypothetical protein
MTSSIGLVGGSSSPPSSPSLSPSLYKGLYKGQKVYDVNDICVNATNTTNTTPHETLTSNIGQNIGSLPDKIGPKIISSTFNAWR